MKNRVKSSVWGTWLLSYLVVLLLPLLVSIAVYLTTSSIIEENTAKINEITLTQTEDSINRIFSEVRGTSRQVLTDSKTLSLMYASTPLSSRKKQNIGLLQQELLGKIVNGSYITDIYVYFSAPEVTASTSGVYSRDGFDSMLRDTYGVDFEQFLSWSATGGEFAVKMLQAPQASGGQAAQVAVLTTYASYNQSSDVICMIVMNAQTVRSVLQSYGMESADQDQCAWAVAPQGQYISLPDAGNISPVLQESGALEDGRYSLQRDGERISVRVRTSELTGWKLISSISMSSYGRQLKQIRNIYFVFLAVCLLGGVGISLYFSKRNYDPVQRLSQQFLSKLKVGPDKTVNEFSLLEEGLAALLKENQDYEKENDRQKKDLRQLWLTRMLRGRVGGEQAFQAACADYNIVFTSEIYLVIGIIVRDYSNLFFEENTEEDEETIGLVNFIVTSVVEELVQEHYNGSVCVYDGGLYCIVNLRGDAPVTSALERQVFEVLGGVCRKVHLFIGKRFGMALAFYISGLYRGMGGIEEGYREALWGMEQMESFGLREDVATKTQVLVESPEEGEEPQAQQRMLKAAAAVMEGDAPRAAALVAQAVREQLRPEEQSFFTCKLYFFTLLQQIAANIVRGGGLLPPELEGMPAALKAAGNMKELEDTALAFLERLCETVNSRNSENVETSVQLDHVLDYIRQNLSSPDLSVLSISEQFGISQSYLLRIFKKNVHMGVLEYISRSRVELAKGLLKGTAATVNDIARKVGYGNSLALIRAFKKLEGVTPSTYRKVME